MLIMILIPNRSDSEIGPLQPIIYSVIKYNQYIHINTL